MHDGIRALERIDDLAVVGHIGDQLLPLCQVRVADEVDADRLVTVLEEVADDRATRLAGAAGNDHATHVSLTTPRSYERGSAHLRHGIDTGTHQPG